MDLEVLCGLRCFHELLHSVLHILHDDLGSLDRLKELLGCEFCRVAGKCMLSSLDGVYLPGKMPFIASSREEEFCGFLVSHAGGCLTLG